MSSTVERFKNRKNFSKVVDVAFPTKEKPEIVFQIKRPSDMELRGVDLRAMSGAKDFSYSELMLTIIKRHIEGWTEIDLEYTKEVAQEYLDSLKAIEVMILSNRYREALQEDEHACVGKSTGEDLEKP